MLIDTNSIHKSHTLNDLSKNIIDNNNKLLNIVIDLDHTIIYAKIFNTSEILKIKITEFLYRDFYLGKFTIHEKTYLIFIRPYFNYFINTISMYFNIFIYTNSYKDYCLNVIDLIKKKYNNFNITKAIYRENNNNSLIKYLSFLCENIDDLHFINNIPNYNSFIKKTIIIDDTVNVWEYDKKNLINIKKFIIGKSNNSLSTSNQQTNKEILNKFDNIYNDKINNSNQEDIEYDIYDGYNFIFFNKNIIKDDILLILSNRLFIIFNLFIEKYNIDEDFNIQDLIIKYKL